MKVKMRRMKSQKSSSFLYIFFVGVLLPKNLMFYCNYYESNRTVKTEMLNQKKYLYFYDRYCTNADGEHVNCYGPPIWDVETEQQEVSCVNVERIWSLLTIKMLAHTHTLDCDAVKNTIFFTSRLWFLCVFDLVSHLFL